MSIFNCNITFKMVEGDSLTSTKNKFIAHSLVDENWNIISSPAKARIAIQELNEEAKEVLGVSVQLFEEDGVKLFPNVDEFDRIDGLKKIKSNLTEEQTQQIKELKQSDSRWNKYPDEDVRRFIDSVFPESKVKEMVYHGSDKKINEFIERDGIHFGNLDAATGLIEEKFIGDASEGRLEQFIEEGTIFLNPSLLNISKLERSRDIGTNWNSLNINGVDGISYYAKEGGESFAVFKPSQAYILSSDKAISDMKKFIGKEDVNKQELINQVRNEIITRDERILPANTGGSDSEYQSNISSTDRVQSDGSNDNSLLQKVGGRTINEVWNSSLLTDLERERYLLLCLQQKLNTGDTFNRRLVEKLNRQLGLQVTIEEGENLPYALYVQNNKLNYDSKKFYDYIQTLKLKDLNEYLDLVIAEELIHIVTDNITSFKERFFVIQEQLGITGKFMDYMAELYPGLNVKNTNLGYFEFVRMAVQQEFFGTTTEKNRIENQGLLDEMFSLVWDYIKDLFTFSQTKKSIQKHIDFINDQQSNQEKVESDLILPVNEYEMSPTDGLYDFTCII